MGARAGSRGRGRWGDGEGLLAAGEVCMGGRGGSKRRARGWVREARYEGPAWDQRDQRACAGSEGSEGSEGITQGCGVQRGARGDGRCVDLVAAGGLERRASLPYHPGLGGPARAHGKTVGPIQGDTRRAPGGGIIRQGDHRPQRPGQIQSQRRRQVDAQRCLVSAR